MLVISLAYFLPPEELGTYGLLVATIGYGIYVIGFEFYLFSSREIIRHENEYGGKLIKSQTYLHLISYLIFLPISFFVFYFEYLPWIYIIPFLCIVVLEHISQEINRLIIALSSQLWASVILFMRSGLWAIVSVILMWLYPPSRNIQTILFLWIGSGLIACLTGAFWIYSKKMPGWGQPVEWAWIKRGIKISIPFFIAALASQSMFTLDRFIFDHFFSKEVLGAYVLYINFAFAITTFLDAGVFVFFYPNLIKLCSEKKYPEFNTLFIKMVQQVLFVSTFLVVISVFAIQLILPLINKEIYFQNLSIFYLLLVAIWIQIAGMIPQYGLYAMNKDRPIIESHIISAFLFITVAWLLSKKGIEFAVPISLCCAFMFSLIYKTAFFISLQSLSTNTQGSSFDKL